MFYDKLWYPFVLPLVLSHMEKQIDFRKFQSTDCNYLKSVATGKFLESDNPAGIYLLKVDNGNTKTMYDICLRTSKYRLGFS